MSPVGRWDPFRERDRTLEALHPCERLRPHANCAGEDLDEAPVAQLDSRGDLSDARSSVHEMLQTDLHRGTMSKRSRDADHQRTLENLKALWRNLGCAEPLAQLARARAPEDLEIDVCVRELPDRPPEKREGAARLEVNADHRGVLSRIDDEGPLISPRDQGCRETPARASVHGIIRCGTRPRARSEERRV